MKVTALTKSVLQNRRERRDMEKAGWWEVCASVGILWKLHCGGYESDRITDVRIGCNGHRLWVKVEGPATEFYAARTAKDAKP